MFDIGFSELLLIFGLTLVVLGPNKLPHVARTIGRWVGRARAMARQFREQLEDEVQLAETTKANKAKEASLATRIVDRSSRRQAPETVLPKGRFASLAEGLEQFEVARGRSLQFAQERAADLYTLASMHPAFGPLNGVEALIIIASHSRRHAEQIREARAAIEKR